VDLSNLPISRKKPRLEGLVPFLGKAAGGNPAEKGLISATGSSTYSAPATAVADLGSDTHFCSNGAQNQWLCYDFKDLRVSVTHYLIRSCDGWYLRSWVIEGSEDGSAWTGPDRREIDRRLNGWRYMDSFDVRNVIESRFIRIRAIGPTWSETTICISRRLNCLEL
jgi:hypothetical protein